jgi:UDPglucose--hexose-1-phosphate uridylyltransferase
LIEFERQIKTGRFLDPRAGFAEKSVESEIRVDPLTRETGRICHFAFDIAAPTDLTAMVEASAQSCPFCPDRVHEITPRFPSETLEEGRLVRGQAVLFPNLFPYDDVSAIAVISEAHFHPMADVPTSVIEDGLGIARDFLGRLDSMTRDKAQRYGIVTWNYMPPSGGSQVHPHMQVIHTTHPGNGLRRQLDAAGRWRRDRGRSYVEMLVETERTQGERWIGEDGDVVWLVPFVPTGILGDCIAVFPEVASVSALSDEQIADFASGLRTILKAYAERGLWSFNLVFLPDHAEAGNDRHWLTARLVPRLYINPAFHVSDVAYMQLIMEERFALTYPERNAAILRSAWQQRIG